MPILNAPFGDGLMGMYTVVIYHLHIKTGWETICPSENLQSQIEILVNFQDVLLILNNFRLKKTKI